MTLSQHEAQVDSKRTRARNAARGATAGLTTLAVVLFGSTAFAAGAPTGSETAITDGFGSLTALVVGVLAAALFGITLAVLGIRMGVAWLRKGASS